MRFCIDEDGDLIEIFNEYDWRLLLEHSYDTTTDFVEVCDLLNNLYEENQALKSDRVRYEEECRLDVFKELHEENEQLKQELSEQGIQIDFLEAENQHMRDLINENKRLKQDKDDLIDFIKKEFPKSHKHILEGFVND